MIQTNKEITKITKKEQGCKSNYLGIIENNKSSVPNIEQYAYQKITSTNKAKLFEGIIKEKQILFDYLFTQVNMGNLGPLFIEKEVKNLIESLIYFEYRYKETNLIKSININAIIMKKNKVIMFTIVPKKTPTK